MALIGVAVAQRSLRVAVWFWQARPGGTTERPTGTTEAKHAASVIKCDSKSAVGMAFDPVAFKKTKHILRAAEFLRDLVTRGVVSVEHISGVVMLADILTKATSRGVFVDLLKQLDSFA